VQALESHPAVIPFPASEGEAPTAKGNYEAVHFNAVKHGILSRYTVLAHEDATEYRDLLSALVEEHQPAGATEAHLVEELAAIIWRKRRVLVAEAAAINRGLLEVARDNHDGPFDPPSPIAAAVPFERGLPREGTDVRELVTATPEELADRQREARHDLEATEKAANGRAMARRWRASRFE
jgi:hypothetical protein